MNEQMAPVFFYLLLSAGLTSGVGTAWRGEAIGPSVPQTQGAGGDLLVDVFLLAGQSNAGGRGAISEVSDESILRNEGVMLYHSTQLRSGQPALTWTTLRPASNSDGYFGPEIGFGNRMADLYPDRQIAIIKHAVGGTNLGADWNPGANADDASHFGPQFRTFVQTVEAGLAALTAQGYTPVIRGMLWQQGERDARDSSYGPAYARNLAHFVKQVRGQFDAANMPFVYGQVLPVALTGYAYRDQVRQGQLDVDQDAGTIHATDGARVVLTDDLAMNADNLHISAAGLLELGNRFAEAIGSVVVAGAFDFDANGKIDCDDVCAMVQHWHENEPTYDVVPLLFGDGIVDVQDLAVLADLLGRDLRLLAHWPFDEADGNTASDRARGSDGTLRGQPRWQPDGGFVNGAIEFDGIDDYVDTPFVPSPSLGPVTVFVWVAGGEPGQVVVSQADGANWLMLHPADGTVMTDLKGVGRSGRTLTSQISMADGNWHQLGLLWDGTNRLLYVDGVQVAGDTQTNLAPASGGLRIGAGADPEEESFWLGLIDDVRVYDRPVKPDGGN